MRKMILFIVVFFIVDRFMNYTLNNNSTKLHIGQYTSEKYALLSESKKLTMGMMSQKRLLAQNQSNKDRFSLEKIAALRLIHSSNRNV